MKILQKPMKLKLSSNGDTQRRAEASVNNSPASTRVTSTVAVSYEPLSRADDVRSIDKTG